MNISEAGLSIIKEFETCELEAYPDPGTGGDPWTIGWGHTKGVKPGDTCTQEEADAWLLEDVGEAERCVNGGVRVAMTDGEFSALVSFAYNVGCGALRGSTLLKKLNAGSDAADEFKRWNRSGGKVMDGLTRRREAEKELFLT